MDSILRYDKMIPRPQKLQDIMKVSGQGIGWLQEEFRIRAAERICMMQHYLPADFHTTIPQLEEVYQKQIQSFVDVRNAHYNRHTDSVMTFLPVVKRIIRRDRDIVPLMCSGMVELIQRHDNDIDENYTNKFLNEFFLNRIGSNVLMSQYLADATSGLADDQKQILLLDGDNDGDSYDSDSIDAHHARSKHNIMSSQSHVDHSIIDPECNVADICRQVSKQVTQLCYHETRFRPTIKVEETCYGDACGNSSNSSFPYIPAAVSYMVQEILKNSAVATARKYEKARRTSMVSKKTSVKAGSSKDMPISVVVSSDEQRVMIFIGDQAGGIPFDVGQHVWSWLYTTKRKNMNKNSRADDSDSDSDDEKEKENDGKRSGFERSDATNLGGFGVGLPLSRLFASYLGGTINLVSIPGYGTHAYIFLPRLPEQMLESVPIRANGWDSSNHSQVFIL